jgi:hypothetical protein
MIDNLHCCKQMNEQVTQSCEEHNNFSCPDILVYYSEVFDEYGLIVHDGGSSYISINYCPWCGKKLPDSKRDKWFSELEALGYDSPLVQQIPIKYKTGEWRKDK